MSFAHFLEAHGWGNAVQQPLAGDASSRRYTRLCSGSKRAILMVDPQDDTDRFARIAGHLDAQGFSAPQVFARENGLMLLEDFGDAQFARVIADDPEMEIPLYMAATDVLCRLERAAAPEGLTHATPDVLGGMIEPAFTHYLPMMGVAPGDAQDRITARLTDLLDRHLPEETVLVHRDYHAENMIWLPERNGVKRVGLLDFQDALEGPPIYDLVSLLQDARRDVSEACEVSVFRHYLGATGRSEADVLPLFHLLGLQRNLRILGIFSRLARDRDKPGYLALIPRVWRHIQASLAAPVARDLAPLITEVFPEPTPDRLRVGAL
jgi:aminoglycoside/choline kinase family phosphotransferase